MLRVYDKELEQFQSTLLQEERQIDELEIVDQEIFQSTLLQEERH